MQSGRPGLVRATKAVRQIKDLATLWNKSLDDFNLGVTHIKRKLDLSVLPLVGELLKLADMKDVEVKDWLLSHQPGYLAFISRWYS